jgi:hypothetical protein
VKAILDSCVDRRSFDRELQELTKKTLPDGRSALAPFLERAGTLCEQINPDGLVNFLSSILDDHFVELADTVSIFGIPYNNRLRIIALVYRLLRNVDSKERITYLKPGIVYAPGLSIVADLVASLEDEHEPQARARRIEDPLLPQKDCSELGEIALDAIRNAARQDTLADTSALPRILWIWKKWGGSSGEAERWVKDYVSKDENLLHILEISTNEARESSARNPVPKVFFNADLRGLVEFVDLAGLKSRLVVLSERKDLNDRQRVAIDAALKYSQPDRS